MNEATPWAAIKGGNVVPDRSRIQGRIFHPCHESSRSVGFPLDVTNSAVSGIGDVQSELKSAPPGA